MACFFLQTQAGLSRTDLVGGEEIVYRWSDNQLRPTVVRRLGMPVKAFLAYVTMLGKVNNEKEKAAKRGKIDGKHLRH